MVGWRNRAVEIEEEQLIVPSTLKCNCKGWCLNEDGEIVSRHKYLPFGKEYNVVTGTEVNSHKFTGHERDAETGLDYMFARYYSPESTFVSFRQTCKRVFREARQPSWRLGGGCSVGSSVGIRRAGRGPWRGARERR